MAALLDAIVGAFRSLFSLRMLWLMIWPVLAALVLWAALAFVFWTPLQNLWLWLYDILGVAEWMTGIEPAWIGAALQILLHLMLFVPLVMLTALVLTAVFGMDAMVRTVSGAFLPAVAATPWRRPGRQRRQRLHRRRGVHRLVGRDPARRGAASLVS